MNLTRQHPVPPAAQASAAAEPSRIKAGQASRLPGGEAMAGPKSGAEARRFPRLPGCVATRGFTLVELILVMVLLVVVVGIIAPSLGNFFRGRNLDSESRRFLALARFARSRAVSEGVPMVLWLDPDRRAYGLSSEYSYVEVDPRAVSYPLEGDVALELDPRGNAVGPRQPQPLPSTLALGQNAVGIRFQPDGFVSEASPQSLHFREADREGQSRRDSERRSVWLTQTMDRTSYEVQTNNAAFARR